MGGKGLRFKKSTSPPIMGLFIAVQPWLINAVAIFTGNWYDDDDDDDDDDDEQYLIVYFLAEGWRCFTTVTCHMSHGTKSQKS